MIPYNRILSEMERQLAIAKRSGDEHVMREALAAIRSLCEVALGVEVEREEKIVPKFTASNEGQSTASFEGTLLEEEDANGGSLFDF